MRVLAPLLVLLFIGIYPVPSAVLAAPTCTMVRIADWPIRLSAGSKLLIDGSISGQKINIALDTGAMNTLILRSEAVRLGLKPSWAAGFRMFGAGGETEVERAFVDEITIGEATRKKWYMFVAGEGEFGGEFSVLLGDDFFQHFDVEFDLANNSVKLYQAKDCGRASPVYWTNDKVGEVAIEPFNTKQPQIVVTVQINRRPVRALLDSGAPTTLLNKAVAAELGVSPGGPGVFAIGRIRGLGKNTLDAWVAPFQSLVIGNETINDTAIPFAQLPNDLPMVLGADFLRAHRVLVAHSQQKVYFTYAGGPVFQLASYDAVARMNPQNAGAFLARAKAWYKKNDYDRAIADYDSALRINPRLADALVGRGIAWLGKGEFARAVADYDAAIGINPQNAVAFANRGGAWFERKDYDQAIADLARAIEIDPKLAMAYLLRGDAERRKGDVDAAIGDYKQAVEVDPTLAAAHNKLAWQLATTEKASRRDGQRAVELALRACELTKWSNPTYIDTLAAAYARVGNFADAIKWQRKAMEGFGGASGTENDTAAQRLRLYEEGKAWPPD